MWVCNRCTYLNLDGNLSCEICSNNHDLKPTNTVSRATINGQTRPGNDDVIGEHDVSEKTKSCPDCTFLNIWSSIQCLSCDHIFLDELEDMAVKSIPTIDSSSNKSETIQPAKKKYKDGNETISPLLLTSATTNSDENLLPLIRRCLQAQQKITQFKISSELVFIQQSNNWSCGYRNIMTLHSAIKRSQYFQSSNYSLLFDTNLSSIEHVQEMIENAWRSGYDTAGAETFHYQLLATKEWIGATECCTLFRYLGLDAVVVDFEASKLTVPIESAFSAWVMAYFNSSNDGSLLPLYIQNQGHSFTIIGYEMNNSQVSFLVCDPSTNMYKLKQTLLESGSNHWQKFIKRGMHVFAKKSCWQIVYIIPPISFSTSASIPRPISEMKVIRGERPLETDFSLFYL